MKHIKSIIIILLVGFAFTGCEDFLDVNTSKDTPTAITIDQALPPAVFYASQSNYDHAEYGIYLSQALTTAANSQTSVHAYSGGWEFLSMNRHPQWRRHFYDLGANIVEMIRVAEKEDSKNFILIGRTIMLQSTMMTTDAFGAMPCSNAYKATSPTYDSQEEIYKELFQEADELVALYGDDAWVNNPHNRPITYKMDRIYGGDMKKWALYAKALRARLWLRKLPNWENNPTVCNKIITMVDEILNDPDWKEPRYYYPGGKNEQNCPWGPYAPKINGWESRSNRLSSSIPTKFFGYAILGGYDKKTTTRRYALDPRAEKIMTPRSSNAGTGSDAIRWLESNIGIDVSMKVNYYPDLYAESGNNPYTNNTGYMPLITEEELLFIKAEAQYWANPKNKTDAFNTTMQAVLRNMKRYGIVESELKGKNAKRRYERFFEVRLPGASTFTIADLMQQKYVAMYLLPEQWTDMRRYNYSSKTNGIKYDGIPIYTVTTAHDGNSRKFDVENFNVEYSLRRPYNLYEPYWMQSDAFGQNSELSPNAWINRLNYDPETEDKYNRAELEKLGAYKNAEWLKKRMIWQYNHSGKAESSDATEWK